MLCTPFSYNTKMADFEYLFSCFVRFLMKQIGINSEKCIASSDSHINELQHGRPKRAEVLDKRRGLYLIGRS